MLRQQSTTLLIHPTHTHSDVVKQSISFGGFSFQTSNNRLYSFTASSITFFFLFLLLTYSLTSSTLLHTHPLPVLSPLR